MHLLPILATDSGSSSGSGTAAVVQLGIFLLIPVAMYFLPIWLGTPVTKRAWEARMWISGSKFMNWI